MSKTKVCKIVVSSNKGVEMRRKKLNACVEFLKWR